MLVAQRIYQGQRILLLQAKISLADALKELSTLATFPGQIDFGADEGDLGIWIWRARYDSFAGPLWFAAEHAHATLVRTGLEPDEATRFLSDAYAETWLADRRRDVEAWFETRQ